MRIRCCDELCSSSAMLAQVRNARFRLPFKRAAIARRTERLVAEEAASFLNALRRRHAVGEYRCDTRMSALRSAFKSRETSSQALKARAVLGVMRRDATWARAVRLLASSYHVAQAARSREPSHSLAAARKQRLLSAIAAEAPAQVAQPRASTRLRIRRAARAITIC